MDDPILYWNDVALQANLESHTNGKNEQTGPTLSSRALAIVHLAMYDAFAGASGNPAGLPPYLPDLMPPGRRALRRTPPLPRRRMRRFRRCFPPRRRSSTSSISRPV